MADTQIGTFASSTAYEKKDQGTRPFVSSPNPSSRNASPPGGVPTNASHDPVNASFLVPVLVYCRPMTFGSANRGKNSVTDCAGVTVNGVTLFNAHFTNRFGNVRPAHLT